MPNRCTYQPPSDKGVDNLPTHLALPVLVVSRATDATTLVRAHQRVGGLTGHRSALVTRERVTLPTSSPSQT